MLDFAVNTLNPGLACCIWYAVILPSIVLACGVLSVVFLLGLVTLRGLSRNMPDFVDPDGRPVDNSIKTGGSIPAVLNSA